MLLNRNAKQIILPVPYNMNHLLGTWMDEEHYDVVIEEDCDAYQKPVFGDVTEGNCLFRFRKNVFSAAEQADAYEGLIGAAGQSQNRGLAAGLRNEKLQQREWVTDVQQDLIDSVFSSARLDGKDPVQEALNEYHVPTGQTPGSSVRGVVWLREKITTDYNNYNVNEILINFIKDKIIPASALERPILMRQFVDKYQSDTNYANPVNSGVAGAMGRYPRIPFARLTSYSRNYPELFSKSFPYLRDLNFFFKELLPERWKLQREAADKIDPRFLVDNTVFSTITVNKNFRTAAHRDAGDFGPGFSNLGVISGGKSYKGGYLVLPEYRVAINIRPGDLLLIDNHTCIHGNTPIEPENPSDDPESIVRCSVVAYLREDLLEAGVKEYEDARSEFIEERRLNHNHPLWRERWNGVSPSWDSSDEWFDWLKAKYPVQAQEWLLKHHHPETSLESFFV